jgi:hypothetical protein
MPATPTPLKRSLQVWFTPQTLLDLAALVSLALEDKAFRKKLDKEYGISLNQLAEIADKMRKEVERV